jgi:hypothetical protein
MSFYVWACAYSCLLHCGLHSFKVLHNKISLCVYTTSVCSFHYVCSRWTIGYVQDMVVCFWTQFINLNRVTFPWTRTMNNKIVNLSIGNWFYINNLKMKIGGCNHNPTSQNGCWTTKKKQSKLNKYLCFAI